ncbi:MAG: hypothetical protein JST30_01705 [Armatimonadetes bacterium]|nr:hypothetical protein [Armatimonadota bacterium]
MKKVFVFTLLALAVAGYAQGGAAGGGRQARQGFGRNNNSMTGLLQRADVQKEIKLTDDQKAKLGELNPRGGRGAGGGNAAGAGGGRGAGGGGNAGGAGGGRGAGGNVDPAERQKQMAEREKAVLDVLNADQQKRLKELFLQRSGYRALGREDVQKDLGLSADQTAKIKGLQDKQREANQSIMEKVRNQELDRQEARDMQTKNDKTLNDELGKVLTADQAAKFKTMQGAAFTFEDENGG